MIIGVTGTNGAGKGTVVEHLVSKGFKHYSARSFIVEEVKKRGLTIDRTTIREVANDLRKQHGPAYVILSLYEQALTNGGDAVVESVRTIGEVERLKKEGMVLFAVDADRKLRYERAIRRGSETDKVSFEEFCLQEDREMAQEEAWDMNVFGVMKMADKVFLNNGTIEDLHVQVDTALEKFNARA
jgi:dephospho-CoA kinase